MASNQSHSLLQQEVYFFKYKYSYMQFLADLNMDKNRKEWYKKCFIKT